MLGDSASRTGAAEPELLAPPTWKLISRRRTASAAIIAPAAASVRLPPR